MSRRSRLIGGVFCLAGGYLIGYMSGAQAVLKGVLGAINSVVNIIPFLPGLVDQLSTTVWYLSVGSVLLIVGILLVVIGGDGGRMKTAKQPIRPIPTAIQARPAGQSCKFCGADMKGSTTYCPSCGRSQS
ncbi:MAG: hypothetical protein OK474_00030 [Thaumarchaeota archaeon]|nr:hypothetical protein [Nitrososphaerota archaeon]